VAGEKLTGVMDRGREWTERWTERWIERGESYIDR
jgi:hypothetical protein